MDKLDLGRASRSSRNKNAKYIDFSGSDSESDQSDYSAGEQIQVLNEDSDSGSDSEDILLSDFIKQKKNSTDNYIGRRIAKEFDGVQFIGVITAEDVLDSGRDKGKRVFTVKYTDGDSEDLFEEEVQKSLLTVDYVDANNSVTDNKLSASKTKNKAQKKELVKVTGSRVWFC